MNGGVGGGSAEWLLLGIAVLLVFAGFVWQTGVPSLAQVALFVLLFGTMAGIVVLGRRQ